MRLVSSDLFIVGAKRNGYRLVSLPRRIALSYETRLLRSRANSFPILDDLSK
jgi:hypothetical protein